MEFQYATRLIITVFSRFLGHEVLKYQQVILAFILGVCSALLVILGIVVIWRLLYDREFQQNNRTAYPFVDGYLAANHRYAYTDGYAYIIENDLDSYYYSVKADDTGPSPYQPRDCFSRRGNRSTLHTQPDETESFRSSMTDTMFGNLFDTDDGAERRSPDDFQAEINYQAVPGDEYEMETFKYLTPSTDA